MKCHLIVLDISKCRVFYIFLCHWKIHIATENWQIQRWLQLKIQFLGWAGLCVSVSVSQFLCLSLILNCVCVEWTIMMHVLTFIFQHLNNMTPKSLMTPNNSQVRVMLTFYIIQLQEALMVLIIASDTYHEYSSKENWTTKTVVFEMNNFIDIFGANCGKKRRNFQTSYLSLLLRIRRHFKHTTLM